MVAKKWEERLPLSDLRGLQLFGAALYHAAKFHESRVRGAFDRFERERLQDLCPFHKEQIQEFASCSELLHFHLIPLGVSKEISAAARDLKIQDIRFTASELYRHQKLVFFVRDAKSEFTAHFDRDTPISHNTDLEGARYLVALFLEAFSDYFQPDWRADFFPRTLEEIVFVELVADICEEPKGRGAPKGRRYLDGINEAANHAWSLRYKDPTLDRSAAVTRSLSHFTIVRKAPEKPDTSLIVANSDQAAFKRVYERLEEIEEREPPVKTREHSNYLSPFRD